MICINRGKIKNLTVGKHYTITKSNTGKHLGSDKEYYNIWIVNDVGIEKHYSSRRFVDIQKYREMQLNELI